MSARHLVVGTAGHIDHGKSALVLALTGTDPDRLQEEKLRGITIDLGFADVQLDEGHVLSFVDVPGHERFVRHMVAGATGIDSVLLVVAADQGVQPQTREHLEICGLLGLRSGLVALTKRDLVDADLAGAAELEVRELLAGTFLEQAPIVPVSARTSEGLDALRAGLLALFDQVAPRAATGVPRLAVDRSFVLRGFGTVVTGTLISGTLREGDEVEVLPGRRRGRIRGLQVHHARVREAPAGRRTAVNLQGLGCDEVPRGSTITRPGALETTRRVWARVRLLDSAPRSLHSGGPVRLHQGTCERAGRLRVLGRESAGTLRAELRLGEETVLTHGDRFILRRPAPVDTVGGGTVLDTRPPRRRPAVESAFAPQAEGGEDPLLLRVRRAGAAGQESSALAAELGLTADQLAERAAELEREGGLVRCGPRWFAGELWATLERRALEELERFHQAEPLRAGLGREELRARVERAIPQDAWRRLLERAQVAGTVRLDADKVALADHEVRLSPDDQGLVRRIELLFREAGLEAPDWSAAVEPRERARAAQLVELLVARGTLVRIHDGKLFHAEALAGLLRKLRDYAARSRTIDVGAFKQLAGVTRKHAIPLLEHLDAERVTRRRGNLREIL